jgi:hypothetical protein
MLFSGDTVLPAPGASGLFTFCIPFSAYFQPLNQFSPTNISINMQCCTDYAIKIHAEPAVKHLFEAKIPAFLFAQIEIRVYLCYINKGQTFNQIGN